VGPYGAEDTMTARRFQFVANCLGVDAAFENASGIFHCLETAAGGTVSGRYSGVRDLIAGPHTAATGAADSLGIFDVNGEVGMEIDALCFGYDSRYGDHRPISSDPGAASR
jgi:hypothetical protein